MTKELEAIKYLDQFINEMTECLKNPKQYAKDYDKQIFYKYEYTFETVIKQALQRLEAIDNANPSEALESLDRMTEHLDLDDKYFYKQEKEDEKIIKQALIKSQEQEKVLEIIIKKNVVVEWFTKKRESEKYFKLEIYNAFIPVERQLTKEEFDLLKRYFNEI